MFRKTVNTLAVLFLFSSLAQANQALSPEEQTKQNEFRKAYGAPGKLDRVEAVKKLEGCTHPSTIGMLQTVISSDTAVEVKTAAFRIISTVPATDPGLSTMLVQLFNSLKFSDFDTHLAFASEMRNSEFKYAVFEALSDYGAHLRYPDLVSGNVQTNSPGIGGGDPNVAIRKLRAEFEKYLKVFNTVTHADITIQDKTAPALLKKWWQENQQKIVAADKELIEKYKQEEADRKKKEKDAAGGTKDQPAGKEAAAKDPAKEKEPPAAADPLKLGAKKDKKPTKDDE